MTPGHNQGMRLYRCCVSGDVLKHYGIPCTVIEIEYVVDELCGLLIPRSACSSLRPACTHQKFLPSLIKTSAASRYTRDAL
jgi:hypothetical protein